MTSNAQLHVVRKTDSEVVFAINAPAVAAALTRSEGKPSATLCARLEKALGTMPELKRGESGKWFARIERKAPSREQLRSKKAARISDRDVPDNDGRISGRHRCGRCAGTGRFITRIENGKPTGPGGECFRCAGKGWHDENDRRRNYGADMNYVPRG